MGDHSVGMSNAGAVSAALFSREKTGRGQLVSTSLLRQGVYTIGFDLNMVLGWGLTTSVGTREAMGNPAINNYAAGDGRRFWIVGLEGARHWPPLARTVGHPEWLDADHLYSTPAGRSQNARTLIAEIDAVFATKTLDEWTAIFDTEPDFFWAPINGPEEILADPQLRFAGGLVEVPDPYGTTTMIASPSDFGGTPWAPRWIAPRLGEHTESVLRDLGRSDDDIAALLAAGIAVKDTAEA
jgi:crotonobetainyl-CoA:carnitine CoA-transferase CaiB-like acyl-CoA transferase